MRVLIACEFSATVRDAFRARGHDAWSCDVLCCAKGPAHHIRCNVLSVINDRWDLIIAHPPCQYLSYAGNAWWNRPGRRQLREAALRFFIRLYNAPCPRVAVENPQGFPLTEFRRPDQTIQPYHFGDHKRKRTCLWLRGLPLLVPTTPHAPPPAPQYTASRPDGRIKNRYSTDSLPPSATRAQKRSVFFPGVAAAMAQQWGNP